MTVIERSRKKLDERHYDIIYKSARKKKVKMIRIITGLQPERSKGFTTNLSLKNKKVFLFFSFFIHQSLVPSLLFLVSSSLRSLDTPTMYKYIKKESF